MSKIYCIGSEGGFMGSDGLRKIGFQILVADADRQSWNAYIFDRQIRPMGRIRVIIPAGPDHPNALIDACIAFYPQHFESCPSLAAVAEKLKGKRHIDFHLDGEPEGWRQLREEARPLFEQLIIYAAELTKINVR